LIVRRNTTARDLSTLFGMGRVADLTDGQLLERFATRRGDPAGEAFAALVERHGPMVLRVCRSILRDRHDAEDAFQATFLVLVRKARTLWVRESIGPWLHGVAFRAAAHARSARIRRLVHERKAAEASSLSVDDRGGDAIEAVLHEEIDRLPERFRAAILLCDVGVLTHEQAARHLGLPVGTVKSRLARGRERLANRLARRGVAPSAGLIGLLLGSGEAAAEVTRTLAGEAGAMAARCIAGRATSGASNESVYAFAKQVLRDMTMSKLKVLAVFLGVGLAGSGGFLLHRSHASGGPQGRAPGPAGRPIDEPVPTPPPSKPTGRPTFASAPGCAWELAPEEIEIGGSWSVGGKGGVMAGYSVVDAGSGALQIILIHAVPPDRSTPDVRPVVFDAEGRRFLPEGAGGNGQGGPDVHFGMAHYQLDPKRLTPAKIAYFAVERITPEAHRLAGLEARRKAAEAGVALLPPPRVGEAFDFDLPTSDGKRARASDFRGKVVLIDCWATTCTTCLAEMPDLKRLSEARRADGLELVGVCFDRDAAKGKRAVERLGMTWPQVFAPGDEATRDLWVDGSEIKTLPRLLLIDRGGILRAVCTSPRELAIQLEDLLGAKEAGAKP